jgi:phenylacetyl-CoA:acceptor oxidoreductase 26-kDa subunit
VLQPGDAAGRLLLLGCIGALVIARALLWPAYQRRIASRAAPRALAALDAAGNWLQHTGSIIPLLLIALATSGWVDGSPSAVLLALAGLLISAAGAWLKFTLITRAGFNQGFALAHLPVRGVPR